MEFVAISRPATLDATGREIRGEPNVDNAALFGPGRRPLWRTWKQDFELFSRSRANPPTEWGSYVIPEGEGVCTNANNDAFDLQLSPKVTQSFSKPLVDKDGRYVRYSVHVNEAYFTYVLEQGWWWEPPVPGRTSPVDFPESTRKEPENGAIVVKAAWKELAPSEVATYQNRFYIEDAWIPDTVTSSKMLAPVTCRRVSVALIGLHILHKTRVREQWFWSTFEHVDVAPPKTTGSGAPLFASSPVATPTHGGVEPTIVVRERPSEKRGGAAGQLHKAVSGRNAAYRKKLAPSGVASENSVWANYRLIDTQWPRKRAFEGTPQRLDTIDEEKGIQGYLYCAADKKGAGVNIPPGADPYEYCAKQHKRSFGFVAGRPVPEMDVSNLTMETAFQTQKGVPRNFKPQGSSCMQCHYAASFYDYSFLLWRNGYSLTGEAKLQ
jgi:hypothetical protein